MKNATDDLTTGTIKVHMSVNEVIDRFASTLGVFNALGIDSCCGGSVSLAVAAERDGVDLEQLLAALRAEVEDDE